MTYVDGLKSSGRSTLNIPLRSDGSAFEINDLADDQKVAMAEVLGRIKEYCQNTGDKTQETLRLTIAGVAGSGKSTWINTLVTAVMTLFNRNDVISVFGPTGSAAFNAGGETINRGFRIPIDIVSMEIGSKRKFLLDRYKFSICLIIDERSMLEADKLGLMRHYMTQCGHLGLNSNREWGGIPLIILVGDDYQLPSINYGAFYSLPGVRINNPSFTRPAKLTSRLAGFEEFRAFGKNVMYLKESKRVNKDQEQLRRILKGLRCDDENFRLAAADMDRLLRLDINHSTFTMADRHEIEASSMFLFANKEPRDLHNRKMLTLANSRGNPVARIKSITTRNKDGKLLINNSHFDNERHPYQTFLCRSATVALNGCNISPAIGLYHGSVGTIEDIVYKPNESPNLGDLPAYVLVNFNQYCGSQLVKSSNQCVPIAPRTQLCKRGCCTRRYIPLILAYGKTIHTYQGQSAGPVQAGRAENAVKRIIVQPGNRQFERNNVGLFYTAVSRATTIGTIEDKLSSAIYFDGPDFSSDRIANLTKDKTGKLYKKARLREDWVNYMHDNSLAQKQKSKDEMESLFNWIRTTRYNSKDLVEIIKTNENDADHERNVARKKAYMEIHFGD
jgi:hypothetical protein